MNNDNIMEINGESISIPFNEKNKLITKYDVIQSIKTYNVDIEIKRLNLYQQALTHKSYVSKDVLTQELYKKYVEKYGKNVVELQNESNERLEFLGDTVIKVIVSEYLFRRYPEEDEGFMTRLKTKIENRDTLALLARKIGLDKFLLVSSQIEMMAGRTSDKFLEDAFEAYMGALYLDNGFEVCYKFMNNILETEIDYADLLCNDTNYKDQLLRYYHKQKWSHPIYVEQSHIGPAHNRLFTMTVMSNDGKRVVGIGKDKSKRRAEQMAARKALIHFNIISELDDEIELML